MKSASRIAFERLGIRHIEYLCNESLCGIIFILEGIRCQMKLTYKSIDLNKRSGDDEDNNGKLERPKCMKKTTTITSIVRPTDSLPGAELLASRQAKDKDSRVGMR